MYTDAEWDYIDAWGAAFALASALCAGFTAITLTFFRDNRRADHVVPLCVLNVVMGFVHFFAVVLVSRQDRFCSSDTLRETSAQGVSLCGRGVEPRRASRKRVV